MLLYILGCCLLLAGTEAAGAGIKAAVKQNMFDMVKNIYVPIIMKSIGVLHIPDMGGSFGPIDYTVHNIQVTPTELRPSDVRIVLNPNTNRISSSAVNIGANGGARVDYKFLFIQDGCDAHIRVHGVGALINIVVNADGEGRPSAAVESITLYIGGDNVDVWVTGNIFQDLLNFIISLLKGGIIDSARQTAENTIPPMINTLIKDIIGKFPLWVDVGLNMALSLKLAKTPWVNADYLCASITGHIFLKSKPDLPTHDPPYVPDFNPNHPKGAQLFLTDYTLRSGLDAAFAAGLLTAQFVTPVWKYDVALNCSAVGPPVLTLDSELEVSVKGRCALSAKDRTTGDVLNFALLGDILVTLKERIKQQTLYFKIEDLAVYNLEVDNPFKYDIKWLEDQINNLLEQLANDINVTLGRNGVPLPTLQGIDYSDIEEQGRRGYFEVFATPILKPSIIRSSF